MWTTYHENLLQSTSLVCWKAQCELTEGVHSVLALLHRSLGQRDHPLHVPTRLLATENHPHDLYNTYLRSLSLLPSP